MGTDATDSKLRSPEDVNACSLGDAWFDCNAEVEKLQNRAQSPPADIPERRPWATGVKEESLKLVSRLQNLAADALEAAATGIPGTLDLYTKVNASLVSCANSHKLAELALLTWSTEQSIKLGSASEVQQFVGKAQVMDDSVINCIVIAVCFLNTGAIHCPDGYCIVYQSNMQVYFALYRSDKQDEALELFTLKKPKLMLSWASRAMVDDIYQNSKAWALKYKGKAEKRFSGMLQKNLGSYGNGGNNVLNSILTEWMLKRRGKGRCSISEDSTDDAEFQEVAKTLHEQRRKAYRLLDKYVAQLEKHEQEKDGNQLGERFKDFNSINGSFGRTCRRGLAELRQSIEAMPEITPEFVRSAAAAGDLKTIEESIQSVLKLGEQCKLLARSMAVSP